VCTAYEYRGQSSTDLPGDPTRLSECAPSFIELPGWQKDIGSAQRRFDLPREAQAYIELIESFTGVPVSHISVGPDRAQIFEADR
jgi:adenylosuccinate synthase